MAMGRFQRPPPETQKIHEGVDTSQPDCRGTTPPPRHHCISRRPKRRLTVQIPGTKFHMRGHEILTV
jgi:hypothetical protein